MFDRIARVVGRFAPWVVVVWVALAGFMATAAPRFNDVATQDQTAFLGSDAPSIEGGERLATIWPEDEFNQAAAIVFARRGGLTPADRRYARAVEEWLKGTDGPDNVRTTQSAASRPELREVLESSDDEALILVVGLTTPPFEPVTNEAVADIRRHLSRTAPDGLETHVTGNAGVAADQAHAIETSVHRTTLITIVLVLLILLAVYRSPVAALVPLTTVGMAYVVALGVVAFLADAGLKVSALVGTFMVVIVFGAGTDYCLFIVSRFKEELHGGDAPRPTLVATMAVVGAVIASSAATVIVGFGAQGVARFGMFKTMGPAMAIAVAVTLVAGLTLTPAMLRLLGRRAFWPQRIRAELPAAAGEETEEAVREIERRLPEVVEGAKP